MRSNPAEFTEEESVDLSYVVLDRNVISEEIAVPESEVLAQYEAQRADFEGSSEKRASHILFELSSDLSEEQRYSLLLKHGNAYWMVRILQLSRSNCRLTRYRQKRVET